MKKLLYVVFSISNNQTYCKEFNLKDSKFDLQWNSKIIIIFNSFILQKDTDDNIGVFNCLNLIYGSYLLKDQVSVP